MRIDDFVTPVELRRLLASLVVFIGGAAIFGLFGFIVVPGLRNANRPALPATADSTVSEPGWLDPTEYSPAKGYEVPPLDPKTVLEPTAEFLARGKELYSKYCEQCHGAEGLGNGPGAAAIRPPPRNLTVAEGWTNGFDRSGIFKTLAEGLRGTSMAAYDYLPSKDRMALVHHVRSLAKFESRAEDPAALDALAKLLARAGEKVPGRIPVSQALARIEKEYTPPASLALPPAADVSPEAEVLRRVIVDPARAATALSGNPAWRDSAEQLVRIVTNGAPSNGFATGTVELSPAAWKDLREALIKRLEK